jgi:hypothetical protein
MFIYAVFSFCIEPAVLSEVVWNLKKLAPVAATRLLKLLQKPTLILIALFSEAKPLTAYLAPLANRPSSVLVRLNRSIMRDKSRVIASVPRLLYMNSNGTEALDIRLYLR